MGYIMKYLKTFESFVTAMNEEDPCWKGYEMIGMKKKRGKNVPNCVPKNEDEDLEEETNEL
jgi:hypothetical protein